MKQVIAIALTISGKPKNGRKTKKKNKKSS
jgi:hypothetical protein